MNGHDNKVCELENVFCIISYYFPALHVLASFTEYTGWWQREFKREVADW